jgi:hypothetical protein
MIGQHDDRVERKRVPSAGIAKRRAQPIDLFGKQTASAVGQVDRKEESAAWNKAAPVVGHADAS